MISLTLHYCLLQLKDHMTQGPTTAVTPATTTTVEVEAVAEVVTTITGEVDETTIDPTRTMTVGVTASEEDMRAVTMIEVATEVKGAVEDMMTGGTKPVKSFLRTSLDGALAPLRCVGRTKFACHNIPSSVTDFCPYALVVCL